jgi:flagellar hook assembly protein FlgD
VVTAIITANAAFAQTGLLTRFELSESAFSPDGDGAQDSTVVTYVLSEDSPSLSVVVYESDSVTVVDTLVAPGARSSGTGEVSWHGTSSSGTPVAEGLYLVTLSAQGTSKGDTTATLPVAVDNTGPSIQILLSEPGIYAPGLIGTPQIYSVTFVVSDASPTFGLPTLADQLAVEITDPMQAAVVQDTFVKVVPSFTGLDGTYELRWDAAKQQTLREGVYEIDLSLTDEAGHSARAVDHANFDVTDPEVGFINVEADQEFVDPPANLDGWAYDRIGIDSLYVKYADSLAYHYIENTSVVDDTTIFSIPLADSLTLEGVHKLTIRAKDAVSADTGRVSIRSLQFTIDRSAPAPPQLDPFTGVWRSPTFTLRGQWSGDPEIIRIFHDGVQVDSIFTILVQEINHRVDLNRGPNAFTVTALDQAKNESPPSNEVTVNFDDQAGLFIPAPFRANDSFDLNLGLKASEVWLRIYDMAGDPVVVLARAFAATSYSFAWNGLNGNGEDVKKGPLVAVAEIRYEDGSQEIIREIFLFESGN